MSAAWIVEARIKGPQGRTRFTYIMDSILFPGRYAQLCGNKSWASRSAARKAAEREGHTITEGECPLSPITQADKDAYHRRSTMRRDAICAFSDTPFAQRLKARLDEEELELA